MHNPRPFTVSTNLDKSVKQISEVVDKLEKVLIES